MADTPQLGHEDSITSQDPNLNGDKTKTKSRRPANTAFRQQRLKAWQPILTPKTVLPLFFAIGIIFAPIGGLLIYASSQVQEITIDYTKCHTDAPLFPQFDPMPAHLVKSYFKKNSTLPEQEAPKWSRKEINATYYNGTKLAMTVPGIQQCNITFGIENEMKPPVLFYYKLTNFYQNHRRYAKSFNTDQLSGTAVSASTIDSSDCTPLRTENGKPYYPCGIAANSLFNDTFGIPILQNVIGGNDASQPFYMNNNSGIAWGSDRELYGQTKYKWEDVAVPPNWRTKYGDQYTDDWHPDIQNDEAFQVWMRLAGLPTFSKLAQRNDTTSMQPGTYSLTIDYHFNVTEYGGTKSIVISTRTVVGGRNQFLGIAYVVVAGICVVLGTLFTVTHLIRPRKLGDHQYLSWDNAGPSTATASGRDIGDGRDA